MDVKTVFGLDSHEWAGLVVAVATVAVILWLMSDTAMATRVVSTLLGVLLGLVAGVIAIRSLK